jgi:hypothetical protein
MKIRKIDDGKTVINSRKKNLLIIFASFSASISVFFPFSSRDLLDLLRSVIFFLAIDFLHRRTPIIINWQRLFHQIRLKIDIYQGLFAVRLLSVVREIRKCNTTLVGGKC